jgi:hypothetical protein
MSSSNSGSLKSYRKSSLRTPDVSTMSFLGPPLDVLSSSHRPKDVFNDSSHFLKIPLRFFFKKGITLGVEDVCIAMALNRIQVGVTFGYLLFVIVAYIRVHFHLQQNLKSFRLFVSALKFYSDDFMQTEIKASLQSGASLYIHLKMPFALTQFPNMFLDIQKR